VKTKRYRETEKERERYLCENRKRERLSIISVFLSGRPTLNYEES